MVLNVLKHVVTLRFVPCHRLPSRSLHICGKQFPVCTRCMAILLGYLAIPVLLSGNFYSPLYLGVLLNVPMLVDGYTQLKKWRESNNLLRFVTGLLSGIGQAMVVVSVSEWLMGMLARL